MPFGICKTDSYSFMLNFNSSFRIMTEAANSNHNYLFFLRKFRWKFSWRKIGISRIQWLAISVCLKHNYPATCFQLQTVVLTRFDEFFINNLKNHKARFFKKRNHKTKYKIVYRNLVGLRHCDSLNYHVFKLLAIETFTKKLNPVTTVINNCTPRFWKYKRVYSKGSFLWLRLNR